MNTPPNAFVEALLGLCVIQLLSAGELSADPVQISSDPFTNPQGQHMTEVEPDVFAYGSTIVAAFQQGRTFTAGGSDIGFATSVDGGATWIAGSLPGITSFAGGGFYIAASDASVIYDSAHGIWIIATLPIPAAGNSREILVNRSADGIWWDDPIAAADGHGATEFFDKPWITCDNTPSSPFFGNCYLEWDDPGQGGRILMVTSSDGGLTWGAIATTADRASGVGGQPLVQPSGRVVVPHETFRGDIGSFISDDGGQSWSSVVLVASVRHHTIAGMLREAGLPSAQIDGDGNIYVAWTDCRYREGCAANDIVFSTSSDGLSWSDANRVPTADPSSTADSFIPGIGVDRATSGTDVHLALAYYYYPDSNCTQATCQLIGGFIWSWDGGNSWSPPVDVTEPISLSWIANTDSGRMVGDYLAAYFTPDGNAHPVFATAVMPDGSIFHEPMITTCGICPPPGAPHVTGGSCAGAECVLECEPGWAHCSGSVFSGCETDIDNSATTCGSCNCECTGTCSEGQCFNGLLYCSIGGGH